jgi:methionine-rich copper-binding protein CopC
MFRKVVATVLVAFLLGAAPALCHAHLSASTPGPGAVVKSMPSRIRLTFTEPIEMKFSRFAVAPLGLPASASASARQAAARALLGKPLGGAHPLRCTVIPASGQASTVIIAVDPHAKPGDYAVVWHAMSVDGHPVQDALVFRVGP